jgi:hypothetical protein
VCSSCTTLTDNVSRVDLRVKLVHGLACHILRRAVSIMAS